MSTLQGVVTSNKMKKVVLVEIKRMVKHPLYGKSVRRSTVLKAHTEKELTLGDTVKIAQCRPMSKDTHYKVVEVVKG